MDYALQDTYKCSGFSSCVAILCVYDERRTRCKSRDSCHDIPIWLKNEVSSHSYIDHWLTASHFSFSKLLKKGKNTAV